MTERQPNSSTAPDGPIGQDLAGLLASASRLLVEEVQQHLRAHGFDDVRPAHGYAFSRLSFGGATGVELAEHLGITKQAVNQMVDHLEGRGYVTRQPDPRDGRARLVVLTDRGRACVHAAGQALDDVARRWTGELGDQRMADLRANLRRLLSPGSPSRPGLRPSW